MKIINFKRESVTIFIEKISGINLDLEKGTVDIYCGDDNPWELRKYKYNEVITSIVDLDNSELTYLEVE